MDDRISRGCTSLLALCRDIRQAVRFGDVGRLNRLNDETGRVLVDFQHHWSQQEPALRTTASVGELTQLQAVLASTLAAVEQHSDAIERSLIEGGSGPRSSATPTGLAVGQAMAPDPPCERRSDRDAHDSISFTPIPAS